jgi:hypothetical protein
LKLSGYKEDYDYFSSRASDVARQLAFAGVAVVWIFRVGEGLDAALPENLLTPLALLALALLLDLLHYVMGALVWGSFHRFKEKQLKRISDDPEVAAPKWCNWPINLLFGLKIVAVVVAYSLLVRVLAAHWM